MKNTYIIPTDKPSKLSFDSKGVLYIGLSNEGFIGDGKQHIYITNDEEVKEGDWFIHISHGISNIYKAQEIVGKSIVVGVNKESSCWIDYSHKIILTTDQDLIKDGVQSIDDKFLEWFVKNPSCEAVVVQKWNSLAECGYSCHIIIPKEEPKQETLEEFAIYNFMSIEPTNKKQQKELEGNRIRLGIKNKEEDFVLKCLLSFDWKREVILYEVEKVSFTGNRIDFRVRVKAPRKIVDYCCSNPFKETGWSLERPDFNSRAWEVWSQLNRYLKR